MAYNQRMLANSSKGEFKGKETMDQIDEEMVIVKQEIEPTSIGLEDVASHYALCYFFHVFHNI
jgi:hypothetical protein